MTGTLPKKVLVTGADGFIGSHLVEELVRQGYPVKAFVYYNSQSSWGWLEQSPPEIRKQVEVFSGDIRDPYGVKNAMMGCDRVLHLAALIAIPYSYYSPDSYVDTNVKGTLNILQAAKELGIEKVVHTSTSEVYGSALSVPINEDHPLQGQSPYSATKIGADQIALSFYRSFDTPVCVLRPFNTYGPRQSARAVIPTVIGQIASGMTTIRLGALKPTRDFSYVLDTARGFIAAMNSTASVGQVINLGSNFEVSIEDTVRLIAETMEANIKVELDTDRLRPEKSEVDRLWSDNSKALKLLNWKPEYTGHQGFKNGLKLTADWFKNPENLKLYKLNTYNI